jgi:hypothetical protein
MLGPADKNPLSLCVRVGTGSLALCSPAVAHFRTPSKSFVPLTFVCFKFRLRAGAAATLFTCINVQVVFLVNIISRAS